jgi:transposase-like protein
MEQVVEWQARPLDQVYPIVYLDCIVVKIRQDKQVINKAIYLALGVNTEGHKELLGMWLSENEGAKFWLGILTELKTRGLEDILIACVDGLKGFPEAIQTVYPKTHIQLCIVHMVRNSMKFVPSRDYKEVAADLKRIYQSTTEDLFVSWCLSPVGGNDKQIHKLIYSLIFPYKELCEVLRQW